MVYKKVAFAALVVILFVSVYFFVSYNKESQSPLSISPGVTTTTPVQSRTILVLPDEDITTREQRDIVAFTDRVVGKLRDKDFRGLEKHIHPVKGLFVSPYQYIGADVVNRESFFVDGKAFVAQTVSTTPRVWGYADGTGDPIRLSFAQFYVKWLYEHDYLQAPNVHVYRKYTTISDVYPNARVVLYEFPGFDEQYGGMDWSGLVVGIEEYEGEWYVVVLTHAQWMI